MTVQPFAVDTDAGAAHARIDRAVRAHRTSRHALAVELLAFDEQGHALVLGFPSVGAYAREVHDLSARTVRDLLHLARCLRTLPALDTALRAGDLPWTKARTLVAVLTPDNEQGWVEAAAVQPVRALEAMVAASLPGDPPPVPEHCKEPARTRLVFDLPTVEAEAIRALLATERAKAPELERTDGEVLAELLRRVAHDEVPTQTERYQVVLEHCPDCGQTAGQRAEVDDALAAEAACDAEVVDLVSEGAGHGRRSRVVAPRVRRAVFAAYRGVCAVPGCGCRLWVDLHHVRAFAAGGGNEPSNLVPLCPGHHRLLHRGRMGLERDGASWVFRFAWGPERRRVVPHVGRRR